VTEPPQATGIVDIDDLAEDGRPQIAATSVLAVGLLEHFGYPETLQMTTDGVIRNQYWSSQRYGPYVQAWAAAADVKTTGETVQ
jgi:hypothetical protein